MRLFLVPQRMPSAGRSIRPSLTYQEASDFVGPPLDAYHQHAGHGQGDEGVPLLEALAGPAWHRRTERGVSLEAHGGPGSECRPGSVFTFQGKSRAKRKRPRFSCTQIPSEFPAGSNLFGASAVLERARDRLDIFVNPRGKQPPFPYSVGHTTA